MGLLISFLDYTVAAHQPKRDKKQVVMKAAQNSSYYQNGRVAFSEDIPAQ